MEVPQIHSKPSFHLSLPPSSSYIKSTFCEQHGIYCSKSTAFGIDRPLFWNLFCHELVFPFVKWL